MNTNPTITKNNTANKKYLIIKQFLQFCTFYLLYDSHKFDSLYSTKFNFFIQLLKSIRNDLINVKKYSHNVDQMQSQIKTLIFRLLNIKLI